MTNKVRFFIIAIALAGVYAATDPFENVEVFGDVYCIARSQNSPCHNLNATWHTNYTANETTFRYIDRLNNSIPMHLTEENAAEVFNTTKEIILLLHGWLEHYEVAWYKMISDAYLNKKDCVIVLVDWTPHSLRRYADAASAAVHVAHTVATFLVDNNVTLRYVTAVGTGVGAHIAGMAGKKIQELKGGMRINKIFGLDPAGPLFSAESINRRLFRSDADFVYICHSDVQHFGVSSNDGTADFYANGGFNPQPGCPLLPIWRQSDISRESVPVTRCSHSRCVLYFIESISSRAFTARECNNFIQYFFFGCVRNPSCIFGDDTPSTCQGVYQFKTNWDSPYAQSGSLL